MRHLAMAFRVIWRGWRSELLGRCSAVCLYEGVALFFLHAAEGGVLLSLIFLYPLRVLSVCSPLTYLLCKN